MADHTSSCSSYLGWHNTLLKLKGSPDGILTLNQGWGKLHCVLKLQSPRWDPVTGFGPYHDGTEIVLWHMTTDLEAHKYCDDRFLDHPRPGGGGGGRPLEVTPKLKLEPIGR